MAILSPVQGRGLDLRIFECRINGGRFRRVAESLGWEACGTERLIWIVSCAEVLAMNFQLEVTEIVMAWFNLLWVTLFPHKFIASECGILRILIKFLYRGLDGNFEPIHAIIVIVRHIWHFTKKALLALLAKKGKILVVSHWINFKQNGWDVGRNQLV